MSYLVVSKKNNPFFVWGWDRKIHPSWSPFVITRQASWSHRWSSGQIFYPTLTLMMDSRFLYYNLKATKFQNPRQSQEEETRTHISQQHTKRKPWCSSTRVRILLAGIEILQDFYLRKKDWPVWLLFQQLELFWQNPFIWLLGMMSGIQILASISTIIAGSFLKWWKCEDLAPVEYIKAPPPPLWLPRLLSVLSR